MANAVVAFAAALFVLMIVAMATAIGFATRGAVAANWEIIEVLHFVGASDAFIAREFETFSPPWASRRAHRRSIGDCLLFRGVDIVRMVVALDRR